MEPPEHNKPQPRVARLAMLGGLAVAVIVAALMAGLRSCSAVIVAPQPVVHAVTADAAMGAIAAAMAPALVVGETLRGTVIDGAGQPVATVRVLAQLELPAGDKALAIRDAGAPAAQAAWTGPDGSFAITGLVPGRYRLRVDGDGVFAAEVRFVPAPGDGLRIVVARQVAIHGRVLDDGQPVIGVNVAVRGDSTGGVINTMSDANGYFAFDNLPEGSFQLWAWQGALAAPAARVLRRGAGPFGNIDLVLEPAAVVVGRVIDRDHSVGVAGQVELRPVVDGTEVSRYARSGEDGVFRVEGVPHGRWIALAESPGYVSVGGVEFDAGRGVPEVEVAVGAVLEGRVVDGAGKPVAGAQVRAIGRADGDLQIDMSSDSVRDRGRLFAGLTPLSATSAPVIDPGATSSAAPDADPHFIARGELGVMRGPIPFPPPLGSAPAQTATFVAPVVTGTPGVIATTLPSTSLITPPPDPAPLVSTLAPSIWTTGSDGHYRIIGLPRGVVAVVASSPGFADGQSEAQHISLGQNLGDVDVTLSVGSFITGTVRDQRGDPVVGALVVATTAPTAFFSEHGGRAAPSARTGTHLEVVADDSGAYRIGPVTGHVRITATAFAHGDAHQDVDVPTASDPSVPPPPVVVELVLVVADAVLTGMVVDDGGLPVRGARVTVTAGVAAGRSAVVDDAGFKIDRLPPGDVTVRIEHPDFPSVDGTASTSEIARLVLPWGGGIEGMVFDHHTGSAISSVTVSASGPNAARVEASTAADGKFSLVPLTPGSWTLRVVASGYRKFAHAVDVAAGDRPAQITTRDVHLELARGAHLAGTVRDARGASVVGARVVAHDPDDRDGDIATITDADGAFHLSDTPTGRVVVDVSKGDLAGSETVEVSPGDERLSLILELR